MQNSPPGTRTRTTRSNSAAGVTLEDIKSLIESSENRVIAALKGEIDDLKSRVSTLRSQISNLEYRNKALEESYHQIDVEVRALRKGALLEQIQLSDEVDERLKRSQNFVISFDKK